MGYIIEGYKIMGKEAKAYATKHRAGIGTAVSIVGTIVSNVMSTKAGAKSARMIDAKQDEIGRPLTVAEKLQLCWKNHLPAAGAAVTSCVGAGYSHNQHVKDFNRVTTAYTGLKTLYDNAQKATKEVLGEKKNAELQDKLNKKYIEEHPEVKKKILEDTDNPQPGVYRKFWEPITGETIWSTPDNLKLIFQTMNAEMKALAPREPGNTFYHCGEYGVKLRRFFELGNWNIPKGKEESEVFIHYGFLKGKEKNGSDDEIIDAYFTPMMLDEGTAETCVAINWETKPSDMRFGDYMKA